MLSSYEEIDDRDFDTFGPRLWAVDPDVCAAAEDAAYEAELEDEEAYAASRPAVPVECPPIPEQDDEPF